MNGRICIVTGATHGIGRATVRALAASGAAQSEACAAHLWQESARLTGLTA